MVQTAYAHAEHPADMQGDLRVLAHNLLQFLLVKDEELGGLGYPDGCRTTIVTEQGHLPEVVTGADDVQFDRFFQLPYTSNLAPRIALTQWAAVTVRGRDMREVLQQGSE